MPWYMKLEPIPNEPALLLKAKKSVLIIADLHIGLETELKAAGINIPSQTEKIAEHMLELCTAHSVDEVIIAGDVKHNVPLTSRQEHYEIPLVFERLKDVLDEVHVVPGNHDGNLRFLLPDWINIHATKGFTTHGLGIFHGDDGESEHAFFFHALEPDNACGCLLRTADDVGNQIFPVTQ